MSVIQLQRTRRAKARDLYSQLRTRTTRVQTAIVNGSKLSDVRLEACQVAALAIRLMEVCDDGSGT